MDKSIATGNRMNMQIVGGRMSFSAKTYEKLSVGGGMTRIGIVRLIETAHWHEEMLVGHRFRTDTMR